MSSRTAADFRTKTLSGRIIGSVDGDTGGPTVIFLAGIHGNEPRGVEAVSRVMDILHPREQLFRGHAVGIRANMRALQEGVRYVDEDMNRLWFPSIIKKIREAGEAELSSSERVEIKRLLQVIDEIIFYSGRADSPVLFVDLHTFSAEGWMFAMTASEKKQIELLSRLYVPMVFGIEETLKGTVLSYYQKRGLLSFGIEGGQHTNELTAYNSTAWLMMLLEAAGCISKEHIPSIGEYRSHLREHTVNLPAKTELIYQHIIEPGDDFKMRPGFKNFQPIKKGEWLATDREGKIHAQYDGYIIMPLYQKQGDDGFFIIREHDS